MCFRHLMTRYSHSKLSDLVDFQCPSFLPRSKAHYFLPIEHTLYTDPVSSQNYIQLSYIQQGIKIVQQFLTIMIIQCIFGLIFQFGCLLQWIWRFIQSDIINLNKRMFSDGSKKANLNSLQYNKSQVVKGKHSYRMHSPSNFSLGRSKVNSLNKSNLSAHSGNIWNIMQEAEKFPYQFSNMLLNQQRNINQFKSKINKEKNKLNSDIDAYKRQIVNHIDDFRLSMIAQLDIIYRQYMQRYAHFKEALLDVKRIREDIQKDINQKTPNEYPINESKLSNSINPLKSMENCYKETKKYQLLNYISQVQHNRLSLIEDELNQLITLTQYENGFYMPHELNNQLRNCKDQFKSQFRVLQHNKVSFLREIQSLFNQQQQPEHKQLGNLDNQQHYSVNQQNQVINPRSITNSKPILNYDSQKYKTIISPKQQTALYEGLNRSVQLSPISSLKPTLKKGGTDGVNDPNVILCALVVNPDQIAIGSKDGTLQIYVISSNQLIRSLKGHKSSICSLSLIKSEGYNYLASGSDYGCNCILVWDVRSWLLKDRLEGHKAAVTAIVDLMDGENIISGSYDKKINVYNLKGRKIMYNLQQNKSPVTSIVLNNSGRKMISCGLDNSLNVWEIERSASSQLVIGLHLERLIQNDSMICSIVGSILKENIIYIGTKEGKVKIIDIEKANSIKTISCCSNAVIEMVVIERSNNHPIIILWPCRESSIKILNTENDHVSTIAAKGYIQFGCGIGPKGLLTPNNQLAMLSQTQAVKEITFYSIQNTF